MNPNLYEFRYASYFDRLDDLTWVINSAYLNLDRIVNFKYMHNEPNKGQLVGIIHEL